DRGGGAGAGARGWPCSAGEARRWDGVLVPLAPVPSHPGDFRTSAAIPVELLESARRRGIPQVQCWALSWRLVSLLPLIPPPRGDRGNQSTPLPRRGGGREGGGTEAHVPAPAAGAMPPLGAPLL